MLEGRQEKELVKHHSNSPDRGLEKVPSGQGRVLSHSTEGSTASWGGVAPPRPLPPVSATRGDEM